MFNIAGAGLFCGGLKNLQVFEALGLSINVKLSLICEPMSVVSGGPGLFTVGLALKPARLCSAGAVVLPCLLGVNLARLRWPWLNFIGSSCSESH